jgi:tryptophan-rich sensory protein
MNAILASDAGGGLMVPAIVAGLVTIVVAVLGGLATDTGPWYRDLNFPSWKPPNWLFGPAWTLIFALIVTAAAIAWRDAPGPAERSTLVALFAINAVLNVMWSVIFFTWRRPDWALLEVALLWLSIVALVLAIGRYSVPAAACLAPYLVWVSFASVLNRAIVLRNPAPGSRDDRPVKPPLREPA